MLKNYFITALNNLIKNKLYSVINIAGLAIGLAACIIIALYVRDQTSYDKQWKDYDRIYRVNSILKLPGKDPFKLSTAPLPAMPLLAEYFKDKIEQSSRTFTVEMTIETKATRFKSRLAQVDPSFINIFQFEVISGSLENTLTKNNNVAISAEVARRHFGSHNPVGQVITINVGNFRADYNVSAVYRIPNNTILDDIQLLSLLEDSVLPPSMKNWYSFNSGTYLKLKEHADIDKLKPLIPGFINRYIDISQIMSDPGLKASDVITMDLQKVSDAHLDSSWDTRRKGGDKTAVLSFAAISVLILLIGCINFTILTTAKATQRAREVAMRKVVGAKRKQLIVQFLGESAFIVLLSMILSMGVVEVMLPVFESIISKTFSLNYVSPSTFLPLLFMLIIASIIGGLYPAFILSGFRPSDTLKANQSKETSGSISIRNILVIIQFSISIILIISTVIIFMQMKYSMNRNPGYNKEKLLIINRIDLDDKSLGKIKVLKQELISLPGISAVGLSNVQPSEQRDTNQVFTHPGHPETSYAIADTSIEYDYFKTYQIPIVAGRDYSIDRDIPDPKWDVMKSTYGDNRSKELIERNIIINESAARQLGFSSAEEAIGRIIHATTSNNINYTIIGVVADNHIYSMNSLPRAEVYLLKPEAADVITIRFQTAPADVLNQVKSVWKKVMGDMELSTVFVEQLITQEFQQEKTEQKILISFSILAILIACLGLFGSASFTVEKRTKEIGLRKVMGAKVKNIVSLLLWQFSKPVLIANIIAWPVAIFAMQSWLERFAYRFNPFLMIPICLVSGLIALAIAWLTVAGNTTRVARSKPIKALRYE